MKKNRVFLLMLVATILIMSVIPSQAEVSSSSTFEANQLLAYSQYLAIVDKLEIKDAERISPHLPVMPEYYGGAYIDKTGHLNILLTQNDVVNRKTINEIVNSEEVIIHSARLSYNTLNQLLEEISKKLSQNDAAELDVLSCGLDEENNCINVNMVNYSLEKEKKFRELIYDGEGLTFIPRSESVSITDVDGSGSDVANNSVCMTSSFGTRALTTTLRLGYRIITRVISTDGTSAHFEMGSIGMGATVDGRVGFFTAAHIYGPIVKNGKTYVSNGICYITQNMNQEPNTSNIIRIGQFVASESYWGGSEDNVFVELDPGYSISPYMLDGKKIFAVQELSNPPEGYGGVVLQGAAVQTCGFKTGVSNGYVISTNETIQGGGATNMIYTSAPVQHGDSGGILSGVLLPIANTFCGIIKAAETDEDEQGNVIYVGSYSVAYATLKNHYYNRVTWQVAPLAP